ncbi:MAG: DUF4870 domain-containing protein [Armatimonadetes bacterium]|nr:DUF4870 domain-containing protein [Armatimonadota bacterium]
MSDRPETPTPFSLPPAPTAAPQDSGNQVLAALGYPIWICALVLILTEKKDRELQFHAWNALYWGIVYFLAGVVLMVLSILLYGASGASSLIGFLTFLLVASYWVLSVAFAVKAYRRQPVDIPVISDLARRTLFPEQMVPQDLRSIVRDDVAFNAEVLRRVWTIPDHRWTLPGGLHSLYSRTDLRFETTTDQGVPVSLRHRRRERESWEAWRGDIQIYELYVDGRLIRAEDDNIVDYKHPSPLSVMALSHRLRRWFESAPELQEARRRRQAEDADREGRRVDWRGRFLDKM